MLGISLLTFVLAFDGRLGAWDGALLIALLIAYVVFALKQSRYEDGAVQSEYAEEFSQKEPRTLNSVLGNLSFIAAGLGFLLLGSNWLVDSAVSIAKSLGVSELIVGLTIVAVGTSLPEVATSVIAALKQESDIAVGNAVGSNIFNLLGVLGAGAFFSSDGILVADRILRFDFLAMVFVALVTLPIFYIDNRISRAEGGLLLTCYGFYLGYVILDSSGHPLASSIRLFVIVFAFLIFLVLLVIAIRTGKKNLT